MEGLPPRPGVPPRAGGEPQRRGEPGPRGRLDQPTREDLRGLRRWVIVAGVWAVAATAIALIALLDTSEQAAEKEAEDVGSRLAATERKLDKRIDALDTRLEGLPQAADVTSLEGRLSRAESESSKAAKDAKSADEKVAALEKQVEALEDADSSNPDSGSGLDEP